MGYAETAIGAVTKNNILLAIQDKGTTKNATAIKAGIAPTTFDRKLNNAGLFTITEAAKIAEVLDLQFTDLIRPTDEA